MSSAVKEWFPTVKKIAYNPSAPRSDVLVYRQYNATEVVAGKSMADWLRFAVCFWHNFRGKGADMFGRATQVRPWDDESDSIENAKRRLQAGFELMSKLGIQFWCFHDRDIAPEGKDLAETNKNLDIISDYALELQQQTGIKCLWGTGK